MTRIQPESSWDAPETAEEEFQPLTAEQVQAHLATQVAKWWLPDEIHFVESLPHTATGKLLKTALREQYRDFRFAAAG